MATNTTNTFTDHTGNGTEVNFSISFSYILTSDIDVTVAGVLKTLGTHYTISGSTVTFTSGNIPANGAAIKFQRDTSISTKAVDFQDGSVLTEQDLDNNTNQILFAQQEITGKVNNIEEGATADQTDAEIRTAVENASDSNVFTDADHSKLNGIEDNATRDQTVTEIKSLIAGSPLDASHLAPNSVDSSELVDGSIDTSHYASGSIDATAIGNAAVQTAKIADTAVSTAKIADGAVTRGKIAGDAIDETKLENNCVTTVQISNEAVTRPKIAGDAIDGTKIADNSINSEHYVDGSIDTAHYASGSINATALGNNAVETAKIADTAVSTAKIADDAVTNAKIADGTLDGRYFTKTESDARYFNVSTGDTIKDGDTFPDNDTTIATTAAINDRIIDLVDDVGGFVPIANETSFPTANPDAENGTGTIVSVKAASTDLTPSGTTVTIANGAGTGNTVTITGVPSVISSGFGFLVETTTTTHTYTFHRLVPKATEVTTVAGISSNVNTVAGISSNVTAVANNATNINAVAGNNSNISAVAGNSSNINSAVSNASNINSVVSNATNINTVASSITNVNNVGGSINNVNSVANNLSSVNSFANTYRIGSSNPTDSLDVGDLFFNTTANELKVYNGSSWQSGVTATGNFAVTTGNTFTGSNNHNDNVKSIYGTGSDLQIFHDGNSRIQNANNSCDFRIQSDSIELKANSVDETIIKGVANGAVELYHDNSKKFETHPNGVLVTGHIYAADNKKILLGNSADLEIFHDGSNSFIKDVGTGALSISGSQVSLDSSDLSEYMIKAVENAQVEAYYDGSKKFETTSGGVNIIGALTVNGSAINTDLVSDTSPQLGGSLQSNGHNIDFVDNNFARFGTGNDLQIYHNGTDSVIDNGTNNLEIVTQNHMLFKVADAELAIVCNKHGGVDLYHDNSKKFETESFGATLTGNLDVTNGDVKLQSDNNKVTFGASADLQIHHDGTNSSIYNGTNSLYIRSADVRITNANVTEHMAKFFENGAVELYYNNVKMIETVDVGVRVGDSKRYIVGDDNDGYLRYNSNTVEIYVAHAQPFKVNLGSETAILASANGAVELYYDNVKKLYTYSDGAKVEGDFVFKTAGGVTKASWSGAEDRIKVADNTKFIAGDSNDLEIFHDGSNNYIKGVNNDLIYIATNSVNRWYFANDGHFRPEADNSYDIGSASQRVRNIYTGDLNLSNEGSSNDVDGTWGSYTIQEGAEDLFLINKRSGKKYKFALAEVS